MRRLVELTLRTSSACLSIDNVVGPATSLKRALVFKSERRLTSCRANVWKLPIKALLMRYLSFPASMRHGAGSVVQHYALIHTFMSEALVRSERAHVAIKWVLAQLRPAVRRLVRHRALQ